MSRNILLVEPDYRNKYPPMGLMKLSTYHKELGDDVRFYKGSFRDFIIDEIFSDLVGRLTANDSSVSWVEKKDLICRYLTLGKQQDLEAITRLSDQPFIGENIRYYKDYYRKKEYINNKKWDRIYITTLFTFHWKITIETINNFKDLCKDPEQVFVGGIAASVVPEEIEKETGIKPIVGLMDKPGMVDDNDIVIDTLPLDYSILNEIDYVYPENDGYYGYTTRGCVNRCPFCVVPTLEPEYCDYIGIKSRIDQTDARFGPKRHLLLLDNNVFASPRFNEIIDEIKSCGFTKGATCLISNEYESAINGLKSGYNDRGYIRSTVHQYMRLLKKIDGVQKEEVYQKLYDNKLLSIHTATKDVILQLDSYFQPLFNKHFPPRARVRYVDFNQGVDARLATDEKMGKLAEIPIRPLRIAFDRWSQRDVYANAVRLAAKHGIDHLSNYMLYNYTDKPIEYYQRMKLNVELCEELGVMIYSFPMKYHPICDPAYFKNRSYLGKHWNRKFVRAVQVILNATKGKISGGREFFEEAFGCNEEEYFKYLYMPEALLIYRFHYKENGITALWWNAFQSLPKSKLETAKRIIEENNFNNIIGLTKDPEILSLLKFYTLDTDHKLSEKEIEDLHLI